MYLTTEETLNRLLETKPWHELSDVEKLMLELIQEQAEEVRMYCADVETAQQEASDWESQADVYYERINELEVLVEELEADNENSPSVERLEAEVEFLQEQVAEMEEELAYFDAQSA